MKNQKPLSGMKGFTVVWVGQFLSSLGTSMANFAIMIWLWNTTNQAMPFSIFALCATIPHLVVTPFAGALVDRWNRKLTMALSDLAAGLSTIIILILFATNTIQVWHFYILGAFAGLFGAFQFPAFSVAITLMVPKDQYDRANALKSLGETASGILAPIFAAILIGFIGLKGILIIDIITFTFAIGALLLVHIPQPSAIKEKLTGVGAFWKESFYGFKYIYEKHSLFVLVLIFLVVNMALSFSSVVQTPLILSRSGNNQVILGIVQSVTTLGGFAGGLALLIFGGAKSRIKALFLSMGSIGLAFLLMGLGVGVITWSIAGFLMLSSAVLASTSNQAFWQTKIAPDIQGRVFAARSMVSQLARPLALFIAGPLADKFFEPQMTNGGWLANIFGWLTGTEMGAGFSVMFIITGVLVMITSCVGYMMPAIRDMETTIPDNDINTAV